MPKGYSRRQWESGDVCSKPEEKPKIASYMIDPSYEGYLLLLQERNKIVKKLQTKDPKQIELERKEQGFSLYLNGANTKLKKVNSSRNQPRLRKTKTSAGSRGEQPTLQELDDIVAEQIRSKLRAKTAPEKGRRKNWNAGSVDIKTHRGDKVKVKAPVILTGRYDDDFEEDVSDQSSYNSDSDTDNSSDFGSLSDSDGNMISKRQQASSSSCDTDSDDSDHTEQISLTITDVKKLRQSLEMSYSIRQSLARKKKDTNSDSDRESLIIEENEDEIEELLHTSTSSSSEDDSQSSPVKVKDSSEPVKRNVPNLHKADDIIVLELSQPQSKERKPKLIAARKKEAEPSLMRYSSRKPHPGNEDHSHTHLPQDENLHAERSKGITTKPGSPYKKLSHGQPASHKSRGLNPLENDKAENAILSRKREQKQTGRQRRDSKSAPGCSHEDRSPCPKQSGAERPSSAALSWKEQLKSTNVTDHMGGTHDSWAIPASSFRFNGNLQLNQEDHAKDHIESIVEKVLKLDERGQCRLLQALKEIEQLDEASAEDQHPIKRPAKVKVKKQLCDSHVMVTLNLLSNWGDSSRVGLTEVQFFDQIQNRLEVNPDDIHVKGARNAKGDLAALCNGKCKTVKERNMWSCLKPTKHHPVSLTFKVMPCDKTGKEFAIGKIRIWNYNKSLNDLNIGVCDASLEVNGKVVYEGQIDKGCGNQVFNYAKDITLMGTDKQTEGEKSQPNKEKTNIRSSSDKHPSSPLKLLKNKDDSSLPMNSVTPTMDNVTLFSNADYEENDSSHSSIPNKKEKRHSKVLAAEQKDTERKGKSPDHQKEMAKDTKQPRESSGVPKSRNRRRRERERRSKMAARLDGSESSIDSSCISSSVSMDKSSTEHSQNGHSAHNIKLVKDATSKSAGKSIETKGTLQKSDSSRKNAKSDPIKPDLKEPPSSNHNWNTEEATVIHQKGDQLHDKRKARPAIPEHLRVLDDDKNVASKPGSPYMSDEDTGSMLDQLRKITKDKKPTKGDLPPWLITTDNGSKVASTPAEDKIPKQKDDSLLDNWPTAGIPDLPTILDGENSTVPKSGRRPQSKHLPIPDLEEDSGRKTPNRMQEIEQKRNEWKRKEQHKLEESWTSLNLFDRLQKGRISLDLQKDVLDEYLSPEKVKPSEPTIVEEATEAPSTTETSGTDVNMFEIPELPAGKEMVINILTTWGDHHYVGLNGVEVFTRTGELATVTKICADPADINVLEGYSKDPRVVSNLIDGINHTRDDTHMWLAPYTKGSKHLIFITFSKPIQIAMMRIWNYNKSRIHSYRGAKDIEVTLDGELIFKGEVTRACGGIIGGSESFAETILFTTDEDILELVSQHDEAFEMDQIVDNDFEEDEQRPRTADEGSTVERPFTSAAYSRQHTVKQTSSPQTIKDDNTLVLKGQHLHLNFTTTWGDPYYLGLTGLEVVAPDGTAIPLSVDMADADPRDLHILPGYERDDRTLDKLLDGVNITTSDDHMWLVPFTTGEDHTLTINLGKPVEMSGLRIWNYNKSPEDTYRGAKTVHVTLDDCQVSPPEGFLLRKGPGNCFFDFAQEVSFTEPHTPRSVVTKNRPIKPSDSLVLDEPSQEYEVIQKPCGFIYQFQLLSTWGDPYYVGLNGIEFYDSQGNLIKLEENNISAYPESVNVLEGMENDTRTPDKLIDGENDTTDGRHMWLAPVLPNILNRVYVIFDTPMEISMIKIWNYRKSPKRGVKDFALLVDDLLVYNGLLEMAEPSGRGILPTCDGPQKYHTVLFTDDKEIQRREKHTIIKKQTERQDVQLMNDREVVATYSNPSASKSKPVDQSKRPKTSVLGWGRKR